MQLSIGKQFDSLSATSTQSSFHSNIRSCVCGKENATYKDLSWQIREVTIVEEIFVKNQCNLSSHYEKVIKIQGLDKSMLTYVFDYVIQDK